MKKPILFFLSLFIVIISKALIPADAISNRPPLGFIENKGQITDQYHETRTDIQYGVKAEAGLNLFIGRGAIHYQFSTPSKPPKPYVRTETPAANLHQSSDTIGYYMYRMDVELIGANQNAEVIAEGKQDYYENYFNEHTNGQTVKASVYSRITYRNIYPHIDWVLYIKDDKLEHEFVVHKGGMTSDIKLKYGGATDLKINSEDGSLIAATPQGTIVEKALQSYQADGTTVASHFILSDNTITYQTAAFKGDLIIDPTVLWGTYYGGNGGGYYPYGGVATDVSKNVFITGGTNSTTDIATTGAYQDTLIGYEDAFVAKFNSFGSILWATYYGGNQGTGAYGIATDASCHVYITGQTSSTSGIATTGAHQTTNNSFIQGTAFLSKLDSSGAIVWGTYYGGMGPDCAYGVATDASGEVYITGQTRSQTGIATSGAYQTTDNASNNTAFLAKFNSSGSIIWGTYYGGTVGETGYGVATDATGNVFLTGQTLSYSGIATSGAYQSSNNTGNSTAFLVKFNPSGSVIWGTYYGGNVIDYATGVATNASGDVYITGYTESNTGIATSGAYQTTNNTGTLGGTSNFTGFLAKFNRGGSIDWATYFGGNVYDKVHGIAADAFGNVIITGETHSDTGIATPHAYQSTDNAGGNYSSIFMAIFNPSGSIVWATYYGGFGPSLGYGAAIDGSGAIYITGFTQSTTGIATPGAYQTTGASQGENFLVKFFAKLESCHSDSISQTLSIPQGHYIIVGTDTLGATGTYRDTLIGSVSGCDSIVTTYLTVSTGMADMITNDLQLFPNPTAARFTIDHNNKGHLSIQIINLLGERLKTFTMTGAQQAFDISDLSAGIYEVQISDGKQTFKVLKLVKQ